MTEWTVVPGVEMRLKLRRIRTPEADVQTTTCVLDNTSAEEQWIRITDSNPCVTTGRTPQANIFNVRPGVRGSYRKNISSVFDAWSLFIDAKILQILKSCTEQNGFQLDANEVLAFVGLQYARGFYGKHHPVKFLWRTQSGPPIFRNTMSRDRYMSIKKELRFDEKSDRGTRRISDPFTLIREVFECFTMNCRQCYNPGFSLCVDEQLMPLKNRCPLISYMPGKPDKYGIKFWILVDNGTKYVCNILPYLGAVEKSWRKGKPLAVDVVSRLMNGFLNKGYNVTMDNFFTSTSLASILKQNGTTIVGTLRETRRGIPSEVKKASLQRYQSAFYWNNNEQQLITKYQSKLSKSVLLLSTMHAYPEIDDTPKQKPAVVTFYNKNKCGVDILDSMIRMYSCRSTSRRWPLAVWENLLDIAMINAWVCYKEIVDSTITRRDFMFQLVTHLCFTPSGSEATGSHAITFPPTINPRQKCSLIACRNKTSVVCLNCHANLCGTCCAQTAPKIRISLCVQCEAIRSLQLHSVH